MFNIIAVLDRIEIVRVKYCGAWIDIPNNTKLQYIATDRSGEVWGFIDKPILLLESGVWFECREAREGAMLGNVSYEGNWVDSLVELSDYIKEQLTAKY